MTGNTVVSYSVEVTKSNRIKYIKIKGFLNNFTEYFEISVIKSENGTTVSGTVLDVVRCKKVNKNIKEILRDIGKDIRIIDRDMVVINY